jgi:hypothetical protein
VSLLALHFFCDNSFAEIMESFAICLRLTWSTGASEASETPVRCVSSLPQPKATQKYQFAISPSDKKSIELQQQQQQQQQKQQTDQHKNKQASKPSLHF